MNRMTLALGAMLMMAGMTQAQTAERSGLKWTFKEGQQHHYSITSSSEMKLGIGEAMSLADTNSKSTFTVTVTVTSVTEGSANMEAKITSVKVSQDVKSAMGAQRMAYDSLTGEGNPVLAILRHAIGSTFTYTMSPTGKITGLKGGEAIRTAIAKAAEEELAEAMKGMGGMGGGGMGGGGMGGGGMGGMPRDPAVAARAAADQITAVFGDESLNTMLNTLNEVLPTGDKAEGDSWTTETKSEVPLLGGVSYTTKFTHGGNVGSMARIKITSEGEFKSLPADPNAGGQGMMRMVMMMMKDMKMKNSTVNGVATFGDGKLADSEINRSVEADGPLPPMLAMQFGGGQGGGGEEMKMTYASKTKHRLEIQDAPPATTPKTEGDGENGSGGRDGDRSF